MYTHHPLQPSATVAEIPFADHTAAAEEAEN
jgi:hypothetical protein